MNSTRITLLALAATTCSFASAQWYPNTTLVGTASVSSVPGMSINDLTSVNGVPIFVATNGTSTGYSGPVGAFYVSGTDFTQRFYIKGLAAVGLTSAQSYSQTHNISWDGQKISTSSFQQVFDGSMQAAMAVYNIPSDTLTPFGHLGYYASSGTPRMAANVYTMSGDGHTLGGQAYWKVANTGTVSTASNVMPSIGTSSGHTGLLSFTNNNGRVTCVNFDGTAAGGFGVGSADFLIWRKVGGVWQPGTAPVGDTDTDTGLLLGNPTAVDAPGRFWGGNYTGAITNGNRLPYLFDSTTGKVTLIPVPSDPPGPFHPNWSGLVTGMSAQGDIVYGVLQTLGGTPAVNLFKGFIWTPTMGMKLMNEFVDEQWPGVRDPALTINNFGTYTMSPDGDWATCGTFSDSPATVPATVALVRLGTPLRGVGILGDYIGNKKAKTLSFTLKDSNGNVVDTLSGPLDDLGRWVWLSTVELGNDTWSLEIDGGQFLRRPIAVTQATKNALNFSLQNGDPDQSGEVDAADIDMVIAAFGQTPADPSWNADVDVDGSDEVDAADIDVVIANFGGVDN